MAGMRFTIRSEADLIKAINKYGFLPFFRNSIEGFSIEEHIALEHWYYSDSGQWDAWEWKGPVIQKTGCAYGKFFEHKAVYISKEWFPDFANYRRDGYDFDARYDEGLAKRTDKVLYDLLDSKAPIISKELKKLGDYRKGGNKGFDTSITRLQEQCYVITKKALKEAVEAIVAEFDKSISEGEIAVKSANAVPYAVMSDETASTMLLDDFFTEWLTYIKPNVARTTHLCYRKVSKRYMEYINENYPNLTLGQVNHNHIQNYLNYKLDSGCKGSTAKQYYLALHSAFAYAVKMELIPKHPMDKLVVPRAERHEATFYNADELNELFEVFKGDKLELVVNIAAYYGLRRCEILGLRWDAIDFKNKTITIQRKIVSDYDDNGEMKIFVETRLKTNSTRRTLPLIPHIEEMLLEKKKMEVKFKKACGKSYNKEFDGFICRDNYGNMLSPGYVTQHFHYVITRNGLKQLRFHDLRHSCASLLLAHDVPMKAIQEWLGHSNFSITANLYSHLEYNAKVNSAETIARVLGGKSEDKSEAEKPAEKKKTTRRKSTSKAASKTPPKKTGGRKKKSDNPEGTGESQMSTL